MESRIRLALVDDHELVRQTWKMVLQRDERIEVIAECSSGLEAIECAEKSAPDVMLMDINMSPINGFEATEKILGNWPWIKIIGVSINNQPAYIRNMMQLGARGYVTKNSPSEEMIKAIMVVYSGGIFLCKEVQEQLNDFPYQ